jgi:DNA-binding winged helix-turn-helix (wHTH) protein/tetratricopeptide (TPR) repeat protein
MHEKNPPEIDFQLSVRDKTGAVASKKGQKNLHARMPVYRFEQFQLDTATGELRRDGEPVYLAPQLGQLLAVLVENAGRLVPRAELQNRLWAGMHTDRERGLNNAINRLRDVLGDSAVDPKWIETIPKRGYRFLGTVETVAQTNLKVPHRIPARWPVAAAVCLLALLLVVMFWTLRSRPTGGTLPSEYWTALRQIRTGGPGELESARDLLNLAIRKNPSCAPAYAELAPVLLDLIDAGIVTAADGRPRAVQAARKAVQLQPESSAAHVAMAAVHLRVWWRLADADSEIDRALWLDPKSAEAWRTRATLLLVHARTELAVEAANRSVSLDPLSPWSRTASGRALFYSRDTTGSAARLEETLRATPSFGPAHHYLSEVYWQSGRSDDARREFIDSLRLSGLARDEVRRIDAVTAKTGLAAFWRSELNDLDAHHDRQGVPYKLSLRFLEIGEPSRSLDWLERAFDQKDVRLLFLRVNPQFDPLRFLPRFQTLLKRLP